MYQLFYFKQKTAYELTRCLEFRRVLFRSERFRPEPTNEIAENGASIRGRGAHVVDRRELLAQHDRSARRRGLVPCRRSEERRAGEQWRERGAGGPGERRASTQREEARSQA